MRALKTLLVLSLSAAGAMAFASGADATTRIQKTFGNWKVDCTEAETGKKACALQYALVTKKDQRLVFSWTIARGGKDGAVNKAVMRTPTGVLLSDGVNIGFEGADPVKINYLTCGPNGCVAEFDFTEQWAKALGANQKLLVNYKAVNEKPLKHEVDLKQFGEAFKFYQSQSDAK